MSESKHIKYIQRCLQLARKGEAAVHPNPMVGCVIVHEDQIIGEGYHKAFGKPHAEVEAIRAVSDQELLKECTLYVNLEPCAHHGKTPPCADLIISMGIPRVVVSNVDPHVKVAGQGIERMRTAGIDVTTGIGEEDGAALNNGFFTFHQLKRPYVLLKWAETSDGFIGRLPEDVNPSRNISNDQSNRFVHELRACAGAILVGTNTAKVDNPSLTTRLVDGRNPLRVVIDTKAAIPHTHRVFNKDADTLVIGPTREDISTTFKNIDNSPTFWNDVLDELYQRKITKLLVEGGRNVLQQLIDLGLWDEIIVIQSDVIWKNGVVSPPLPTITSNRTYSLGSDTVHHYLKP